MRVVPAHLQVRLVALPGRRSSWPLARRALAWLGCAGALALSGTSAAEERAAAAVEEARPEAVLVGSSSFTQPFGFIIAGELERWGYEVTRKGVPGAGLARPDYRDMNEVVDALPISPNTAAVFVYLGVNDAQALWLHPHERPASGLNSIPYGTAEWDAAYLQRTYDFYDRICKRGAERAIVLLPVDVNLSGLQQRLERIRELQVRAASLTSCAVALSTAGDAGHFELDDDPRRLPDGFHMTRRGAQAVWDRVREQISSLLDARR